MAENSNIVWTDHSFSPWQGCTKVSPGCENCLTPETPVLMSNLTWKPIQSLATGDTVLGFDEEKSVGENRLIRRSTVEAVWKTRAPTVIISMASGRVITASMGHKFLVDSPRGGRWVEAKNLALQMQIRSLLRTPSASPTDCSGYQSGYIAGVTAGDGTMRFDPSWRSDKAGFPQMYWRVAVCADDRIILDRLCLYLANIGVETLVKPFSGGVHLGFNGSKEPKPMLKVEHRSKAAVSKISDTLTECDRSWKAGWLAGFLDTDGTASGSMSANGVVHRWSQVYSRNDYLDRTVRYLAEIGFEGVLEKNKNEENLNRGGRCASNVRFVAKTIADRFDLISTIAPALERKGIARLFGDGTKGASRIPRLLDQVTGLSLGPEMELVDITTSTRTFVANGIATHNCYAQHMVEHRFKKAKWGAGQPRVRTSPANWAKPLKWNRDAVKYGTRPFVFCAPLADVFDNEVPTEWRDDLFDLIRITPNLIWLLLTKRVGNVEPMTDPLSRGEILPRNVAIGATFVNQMEYDRDRIKLHNLKRTIAPLFTFGSFEPMLGPIILDKFAPDWVIVGGESRQGSAIPRLMDPQWARDIRDQSKRIDRRFFLKQMTDHAPIPADLMVREFPMGRTAP